MRKLEIRRIFGGNCILSGVYDPPLNVASVKDLKAKLRECGVTESGIDAALLELKDSRHLTITLPA
ncbi:MAG: hypothetical protein ABI806_11990 [Candidatus Solibacter sp.]